MLGGFRSPVDCPLHSETSTMPSSEIAVAKTVLTVISAVLRLSAQPSSIPQRRQLATEGLHQPGDFWCRGGWSKLDPGSGEEIPSCADNLGIHPRPPGGCVWFPSLRFGSRLFCPPSSSSSPALSCTCCCRTTAATTASFPKRTSFSPLCAPLV